MRDAGPAPIHRGFFRYPQLWLASRTARAEIPLLSAIRFKALLEWSIPVLATKTENPRKYLISSVGT
jgi:hypothetical protein